jgi:NAD(P)-dependent dehydrogenase (short-subunit alcohol dehydrogenase family)
MAGVVGYGTVAAYAASKFTVEGLSLSVAQEIERFGIKVTVCCQTARVVLHRSHSISRLRLAHSRDSLECGSGR